MDVRSILGDAGEPDGKKQKVVGDVRVDGGTVKPKVKGKKLKGLAREVYHLTGGLPPVVPSQSDMYKSKPKAGKGARWVWKEFGNSARSDGLRLSHWIREDEHEEDLAWTKEETDYMIDLCRDFNLRFPVIADRYDHFGKRRTIEDIKDRYYSIILKLFRARNPNPTQSEQNEMKVYEYDKEQDTLRRIHLDSLYRKTVEEIEEEEFLLVEALRIEQNQKRLQRERETIMKQLSSSIDYTFNNTLLANAGKRGSIKDTTDTARKKKDSDEKSITQSDSRRGSQNDPGIIVKDKIPAGVFTRSSRLIGLRPAVSKQVDKILVEMELPLRPTVPTAAVCQKFDDLRITMARLIELKKVTDKVQAEINIHQLREDPEIVSSGNEPISVPEFLSKSSIASETTVALAPNTKTPRRKNTATSISISAPSTSNVRKKSTTADPAVVIIGEDVKDGPEATPATKKRKYQRRQSDATEDLMPASSLGTGSTVPSSPVEGMCTNVC